MISVYLENNNDLTQYFKDLYHQHEENSKHLELLAYFYREIAEEVDSWGISGYYDIVSMEHEMVEDIFPAWVKTGKPVELFY